MKIFFTHFYGRMSDVLGIINCGAYAEDVTVDEEQYALENGWTKVESAKNKDTWYQARQTRIKVSELKYNKKIRKMTNPCKDIESKVKTLKDCNVEELRRVYSNYIKLKSDQYKESDEIFSDFYTHDEFFDDLFIDPEYKRVIEYRENGELHGFVICRIYKKANAVTSIQFCWDYHKPRIFLGKYSCIQEIEMCKDLGVEYVYLGGGYESMCIYKSMYQGFEWWTGSEWSKDKEAYKTLCSSDTETKTIYDLGQLEEDYTGKFFFSPSEISERK
jgi:arginyl-tRNA--protein-N-Asp/Glu arginylyltransferase